MPGRRAGPINTTLPLMEFERNHTMEKPILAALLALMEAHMFLGTQGVKGKKMATPSI